MIDNVILNSLANQNKAPYELIKKRENKGLLKAASNIQLTAKHSKQSEIGHSQTNNRNQFQLKPAKNQSTLFQSKTQRYQTDSYQTSCRN